MKPRAWPALLVAPSMALAHLSVVYALTTPSCATQQLVALHAASALVLLVALGCTAMAVAAWRREREPSTPAGERRVFVAQVSSGVGALACLVIVALWIPPFLLSPCWS